jgi:phosphoribosylaminoimidazole-succinocarboxamide synthase
MSAIFMRDYKLLIQDALKNCLTETHFSFGKKYQGKVRDRYDLGENLLLITTDRLSAFDRVLAAVPFKGQVLNLISAWWFKQTEHIMPNHVIAVPDENVTVAKKCIVFPIEFVVRAYMTGSTSTSLWTQYRQGVRNYCGIALPDGIKKNQALASPIITPTTKSETHDSLISPEEIIKDQWMTKAHWDEASELAMQLFEYGTQVAKKNGLILVDTKYEMGLDSEGNIVLVDEIHTPDSSRYWLADSYEERFRQGQDPENIDKEFLRVWFADRCDPYNDVILPKAPDELIITLSCRYIELYEKITGKPFDFPADKGAITARITHNMTHYLGKKPCAVSLE